MTQTPPSSYLASRLAQASGQPLPNGEALAAFTRRDDALAAFDVLSAAGFPVTALYLVNEGVKQVEYPLQRSYGRMLLSSLIWGIIAGLGCAALTIGDGSDFLGRAASTVPLSVAIFMVWTLVSIRRGGNSRYPMRGEAIPERTTMYALSEYAGQARMILRDTPGFAQAMRSVHRAAYGGGNATQQPGTTGTAAPRTGSTPSAPAGTAGTAAGTESEPAKNTTGALSGYGRGASPDVGGQPQRTPPTAPPLRQRAVPNLKAANGPPPSRRHSGSACALTTRKNTPKLFGRPQPARHLSLRELKKTNNF